MAMNEPVALATSLAPMVNEAAAPTTTRAAARAPEARITRLPTVRPAALSIPPLSAATSLRTAGTWSNALVRTKPSAAARKGTATHTAARAPMADQRMVADNARATPARLKTRIWMVEVGIRATL